MIELKYEHDYLKETADLVAVATGMEVIIADNTGLVIADSQHDEDYEILSDGAILRNCMVDSRKIIYTDIKKENPRCHKCIYADSCKINSIISMPIKSGNETIGGIGLYSYDQESQSTLLKKMDSLIEFVDRILDMLLSKIEEKAARIELETAKEQQRLIIQTLDEAIIGFDEKDNIIHRNPKFDIMFDTKNDTLVNIDDVTALFRNEKLIEFIGDAFHERVSTKEAFAVGNEEIIIIYKPVIVENRYRGSLLYFRKGSDVYKDVRAIKNNYYNITFNDITCRSEALIQLKKDAERFAKGPSNILIHGKSGTGKEMFARAIHNARKSASFSYLNPCRYK
ncbi:MAG: sigma 54-interacting transcriptional regulator [Firmicutes bacterium]|nr:sigma 54-interacting transcriptional regulator [Bacillota bacterium]